MLADYPGEEEGTLRVGQGDLVEVFDISRNEWCLVRPVGRTGREGGEGEEEEEEEEGWVPAAYLKPYSGGGFGESITLSPRLSTEQEYIYLFRDLCT